MMLGWIVKSSHQMGYGFKQAACNAGFAGTRKAR